MTSLDVELEARLRVLRKEERSGTSRYRIKPDLLINCAAILISGLISCAAILVSTGDMGEQIRVNSYQAESDNLAKLDDLKAYTHSLQESIEILKTWKELLSKRFLACTLPANLQEQSERPCVPLVSLPDSVCPDRGDSKAERFCMRKGLSESLRSTASELLQGERDKDTKSGIDRIWIQQFSLVFDLAHSGLPEIKTSSLAGALNTASETCRFFVDADQQAQGIQPAESVTKEWREVQFSQYIAPLLTVMSQTSLDLKINLQSMTDLSTSDWSSELPRQANNLISTLEAPLLGLRQLREAYDDRSQSVTLAADLRTVNWGMTLIKTSVEGLLQECNVAFGKVKQDSSFRAIMDERLRRASKNF